MPILNITIDDASPLITYDGSWTQAVSNEAYADGYTQTTSQNASATLEFWGTWIMVNGSKNDFHGGYTVILDGFPHALNGSEPYPGSWKTPIFISDHLDPGLHTLTISNDEWATLDIDSITWSCDIGPHNDTSSSMQTNTVDDVDKDAFTYLPHGSWDMNPPNLTMFSEGTGHSTNQPNASVNFTFSRTSRSVANAPVGDAVSIYGTAGPGHSRYSVWRPDQPGQEFSATRDMFSSQVLLYTGIGFGQGNQTVTLLNEGPGLFQIDYAVVHTANVLSTTAPTSQGSPVIPPDSNNTLQKGLSAGVIVAITFTALLLVFLLAALLFLLQRNKTLWYRLQRGYKVQSQFDIGTPPNGVTPLLYSTPPPARIKVLPGANNDGDYFEAQPLNRAATMESHLSASTLVADAGSFMTERGFPSKALRLASRWGVGSPSSSQATLSQSPSTRHSGSTGHLSLPQSTRHLSRAPSIRPLPLNQEESHFYDPSAAAAAGIEEVPEDGVEELLRHPIQQTGTTDRYDWQSALP
ncbi:hypothetical protein DFH06DRAFT_1393465 [Mycena polygramma]|nr:hypothetical protein DFH06DRAFT_1393465 [Mycena polygramma]